MARYTGPVNKKMRFLGLEIAKKLGKKRKSPRRRFPLMVFSYEKNKKPDFYTEYWKDSSEIIMIKLKY
ncbi:MAG: hypothetical protein Ct9H90mP2_10730 [Dehalococcoidia bacterium]|nr:MAG: hypothetical protein Ct9H90mP2_10730 [Dehalococcoidia bacterium]